MINRIKEIASFYGLSSTAFADKVEIPRPVISHIFSERNKPSLEVMHKIGIAFPEVDLVWLLYGNGEMLKKSPQCIPVLQPELTSEVNPLFKEEIISEVKPPKEKVTIPPTNNETKPPIKVRKKAIKIVFFYEDNSFEEFRP